MEKRKGGNSGFIATCTVILKKRIVFSMAATLRLTVVFSAGLLLGFYQEFLRKRLTYSTIEIADLRLSPISSAQEELWHGSNS